MERDLEVIIERMVLAAHEEIMKRDLEITIERASQASYAEDATMIIGRVNGEWQYCHNEDMGRQAEMVGVLEVDSLGLVNCHDEVDCGGLCQVCQEKLGTSLFW